nr:putative serine/threonine/dual specificity protein kinase, catalytic domain-containing protein [Tanacetum cinerariifolium]
IADLASPPISYGAPSQILLLLLKGLFVDNGDTWISINMNGEVTKTVSATKCFFGDNLVTKKEIREFARCKFPNYLWNVYSNRFRVEGSCKKQEEKLKVVGNLDLEATDFTELIKLSKDVIEWTTKEELYCLLRKGFLIDKEKFSNFSNLVILTTLMFINEHWLSISKNMKKRLMLPASTFLKDEEWTSNSIPDSDSRFYMVTKSPISYSFTIDIKADLQLLSPPSTYSCFLIYKLPENDKYSSFEGPMDDGKSSMPLDTCKMKGHPKLRKDGWMEVFNGIEDFPSSLIPINGVRQLVFKQIDKGQHISGFLVLSNIIYAHSVSCLPSITKQGKTRNKSEEDFLYGQSNEEQPKAFGLMVCVFSINLEVVGSSLAEGICEIYCEIGEFDHLKIPMKDIVSATNNFDRTHVIGGGGFGRVYKGDLSLPEGQMITVAFKQLDRRYGQGNIEFWKEIMMLTKYKHENLISLMHFCIEGDEMILVYEYASRGSLDRYLGDTSLTWIQRLKICIGAARGLNFLHQPTDTYQRIIHRDIKSANILIDENWTAKVSDFGLSKFGPANQPQTYVFSNVVGTPGYCDPLYWELGFLTKESDVYSFGVVLFEVLCGRLCFEYRNGKLSEILVPKWRKYYEEKSLDDILLLGLKEQMDIGDTSLTWIQRLKICIGAARGLNFLHQPTDTHQRIIHRDIKSANILIDEKWTAKVSDFGLSKFGPANQPQTYVFSNVVERPMMAEIVKELEFALKQQEVLENLGRKVDIEELMRIADIASPPISYGAPSQILLLLLKGLFVDNGDTWISINMNGEVTKTVSATKCFFGDNLVTKKEIREFASDDESLSDEDVLEDNVKIYSNSLFKFDDEYISSDVNLLFDEVLEDIECKDSYDPNLNESTFLVTPLSDSNEDEYFTPDDDGELLLHHDPFIPKTSVASILEGFIDEPPLEKNDDLFDLESKNDD